MTWRGRKLLALSSALACLAFAWSWWAPEAHAEFGPIELVSKSAREQADEGVAPAISADGRYVAFAGRIGGREGVFRKDLQSGAIAAVVDFKGELNGEAAGAAKPSISADGRYVAFTTTERLDPTDDPEPSSPDVYVADLSAAPTIYELASAGDGSHQALSGGSVAAGRVSLSEDGRRVVFSNQGEVYVRELGTTTTILVSARRDPGTGAMTSEPVPGGGALVGLEAAAISGDGTTVAWVGRDLPEQVPMLADEEARVRKVEPADPSSNAGYHEPLWRRVPGPLDADPPTRRMVGGGDPLAPGCPPGGTLGEPACQGPFPEVVKGRVFNEYEAVVGRGWGIAVPRLSRDGNTVALVGDPDEVRDLFVVDMAAGLSRRQAVRRLTQWVNPIPGDSQPERVRLEPQLFPLAGPILDCAISPDGKRIAFTTQREVFPLSPPSLVSPPPTGDPVAELYQLDLTGETIERVTPGGTAGASLGGQLGASGPSYSGDGRFLSFASDAFNLVPGDTNERSDAFVVESPPVAPVDESTISARPATLVVKPLWRMTVAAASLPNGLVRVVVGVPGMGTVRTHAAARLGSKLKLRRISSAQRRAPGAGVQRLVLRLPRKMRRLAHRKGGLYAQLDVGFTGPGGKALHAALDARFLVHARRAKK